MLIRGPALLRWLRERASGSCVCLADGSYFVYADSGHAALEHARVPALGDVVGVNTKVCERIAKVAGPGRWHVWFRVRPIERRK